MSVSDKEKQKNWPSNQPARRREYRLAYQARHPETLIAKHHRDNLRRKFKMTPEQYAEILAVQGGSCAICGATETDGRRLSVDHDHVSGAVRGILCRKCNWALGQFDHDDLLLRAGEYLAVFAGHPARIGGTFE